MGVKVRQKKKGKGQPWWVFVSHNNRRTSRKIGNKGAADVVAATIEAKLALGEFNFEDEKPVPTFKEYAESFLKGFSKINHKASTHSSYKAALEKHIYPEFGKKSLNMIRKKDIKEFLTNKQQETFKRLENGE